MKLFKFTDGPAIAIVGAIRLHPQDEAERELLTQAGWGANAQEQGAYVLMFPLDEDNPPIGVEPSEWEGRRMLEVAHRYLQEHFDVLQSGAVIELSIADEPRRETGAGGQGDAQIDRIRNHMFMRGAGPAMPGSAKHGRGAHMGAYIPGGILLELLPRGQRRPALPGACAQGIHRDEVGVENSAQASPGEKPGQGEDKP